MLGGLITFFAGVALLIGVFFSHHITRVPTSGGEYDEALIGEPKYINPLFSSANDVDSDLVSLVYAGLFHYTAGQGLEPYVAQSYTLSADQKTYIVHLRPDVNFSDGQPLTADDVVFTFALIQNPSVGSPLMPTFQGVKVAKLGDYDVSFTLKQPFAPFLNSLTVGILPEHVWGNVAPASIELATSNLQPIGAGPWQFNKLVKNDAGHIDSYTLIKNQNFFGPKAYLDTLTFRFFDAYDAAIEALRSHTVNTVSFVPTPLLTKLQSKNLTDYSVHLPEYTALFFNQTENPVLKDVTLRSALAESIDKNEIVASVLNYNGDAIVTPFLADSIGYNPGLKPIPPDSDSASTLLDKTWTQIQPEDYFNLEIAALKQAAASTTSSTVSSTVTDDTLTNATQDITTTVKNSMDESQSFYRRDKNNNILALTITTVDTPEYTAAAQLIASMWEKIGVKTTVNVVSSRDIVREVLQNRNYEILLYGEIMGPDNDPYPFWHSSQSAYPGLNLAEFSDPTADQLLEQARTTLDIGQRADLYQKFQNILIKELPAIFLYTPNYTIVMTNNVKGVTLGELSSPSDRFDNSNAWYVKTKLQWK